MLQIGIVAKNFDGLSQFPHRRHIVALRLIDVGQQFKEGDASGPGGQILSQERFRQPVVLSTDGFIREGLEGLPGGDQTSKLQVESRK